MEHKKCAHETCTCDALPLEDFCGETCQETVASMNGGEEPLAKCKCQHSDCGGEPAIQTQSILAASQLLAGT